MDLDEWDRLVNVNLQSVLLDSHYAIPHMQKAGVANMTKSIGSSTKLSKIRKR